MDEEPLINICRTCLSKEGEFKSVFVSDEKIGVNIHLAEMIMEYTSVRITLGDGLPEQICGSCAQKAVQMYLFKQCCEKSDQVLRNRLQSLPSNEVEYYEGNIDVNNDTVIIIKPEFHVEESQTNEVSDEFERFNDAGEFSDEIEADEGEKGGFLLQCCKCAEQFFNEEELNIHEATHFAHKEFKCDSCNKTFVREENLLRHKIVHAMKIDDYKMKVKSLEQIVQDHMSSDDLKCVECDLEFGSKEETVAHNVNKHFNKVKTSLQCAICMKKFSKLSHLTRHVKIHATIKPHACKLCNKRFARHEQLLNHMNAHSGVKPHVCKICSKGFNQISNLKDHMRTHNGEKPFLCSTCGKGFNQLGNLRQHTIRHSGIKAHLCSICGNGFASKGELCAHLRKHTGARPFVCPICNHGFTTSSSLTKHKRIHSGEKPYECEVCKMKFSRSGILARHKRTHTGEKPYVCKFCTKAFSQSNDLSSHLRIHTGEKPFICDTCGQAFRQSSALKTHKKTHAEKSGVLMVHSSFLSSVQ